MAGPKTPEAARASDECRQVMESIRLRLGALNRRRKAASAEGDMETLQDLRHWLSTARESLDMALAPDPGEEIERRFNDEV